MPSNLKLAFLLALLLLAACGTDRTSAPAQYSISGPQVVWQGPAASNAEYDSRYQAMKECVAQYGRLQNDQEPYVYVYSERTFCGSLDQADGCAILSLNAVWTTEASFNHGYWVLDHEFVHILAQCDDDDEILTQCR